MYSISGSGATATTPEMNAAETGAVATPAGVTIGSRELERLDSWTAMLRRLGSDRNEALMAFHEYLTGGSTQGYEEALRRNAPPPPKPTPPPARPGPLSRLLMKAIPAPPPEPRRPVKPEFKDSWPEAVLKLEARGLPTKLTIGARKEVFLAPDMQGPMNRGFKRLEPSRFELVPHPTGGAGNWKADLFATVFQPAINALEPNQTAVLGLPNADALLIGKDSEGTPFGISTRMWERPEYAPKHNVLRGRELEDALDAARYMPSTPANWVLVTPQR